MRFLLLALALPRLPAPQNNPPDAPKPPHAVGMANPASVYCPEKGGEQVPIQSPQGVRTECKLPGGEVIDEWTLYRRDHPQPAGDRGTVAAIHFSLGLFLANFWLPLPREKYVSA